MTLQLISMGGRIGILVGEVLRKIHERILVAKQIHTIKQQLEELVTIAQHVRCLLVPICLLIMIGMYVCVSQCVEC